MRPHGSRAALLLERNRRARALLLLVCLFAWMFETVHVSSEVHLPCPVDGRLVHADHAHGAGHGHGADADHHGHGEESESDRPTLRDGGDHGDEDGHGDHCFLNPSSGTRSIRAQEPRLALGGHIGPERPDAARPAQPAHRTIPLVLLAPGHSPPA